MGIQSVESTRYEQHDIKVLVLDVDKPDVAPAAPPPALLVME